MNLRLALVGLVWLVCSVGISQPAKLTIKDKVSNAPIAFAHVIGQPMGVASARSLSGMTDEKGMVSFETEVPLIIISTYVGYQNLTDTLSPGETRTAYMEPMVYNVDEVVVTGQITPERVDQSIYKVKVISSLSISQKAANDLSEMLAGELNIRSSRDNIFGSSIMMQGLGGEHVKFLVDGVPVIGRQNGELDLQQMNMQNVDHLEIIEGPMSVIYGSNALAGVINIITKNPNKMNATGYGEYYTESVGVYNVSAGGSISSGKNSVSFNGSRNFFGGFSVVDTSRWQQWKPKLQYDADLTYMYHADRTDLKASLGYFNEQLRDLGIPSPVFNYDKAFDKYYFTSRWSPRVELNQKLFATGNLQIVTAYSWYQRIKNTFLNDLTTLTKDYYIGADAQDTTWFDSWVFRPVFSNVIPGGNLKYQLGFDMTYEQGGGKRIEDGQQALGDYAAFISLAWTPLPQLSIQPGLRAIYNTKYNAPLVYSLNAKWNITEPLAIRASMAKGFRAPSIKELYLYFVDINHNIVGNPDLKAETSENFSVDLTYNTQRPAAYNWGIDLGVFYNHLHNKIELQQMTGELLLYSYVNVDQYYTQGFDVNFNNRVYPWLKLVVGYALTGRKLETAQVGSDKGFLYSNDITVQSHFLWVKPGLDFNLYYKYNGAFPGLILDADGEQAIATIAGYNTLDINVSKRLWKNRLLIQTGAKNLFNNTNVNMSGGVSGGTAHSAGSSGSVPVNWGRTWFVRLQLNLSR